MRIKINKNFCLDIIFFQNYAAVSAKGCLGVRHQEGMSQ